jgi:hypothetical protein
MIEAIVHYNLGSKQKGLPPQSDLMTLTLTVFVFSIINTYIIENQ